MAKDPKRPATYQDVLDAPEHLVAEIIDGELFLSPRPAVRHSRAGAKLVIKLDRFDQQEGEIGGWWILPEVELHLRGDVLVPDVAGWRIERMPTFPDGTFVTLAPDWLCEVLSPSTARLDREKKLRVYAREGVSHVWLVDPLARSVEIFALDKRTLKRIATCSGDDPIRAVPFDAIEIKPNSLFGPNT